LNLLIAATNVKMEERRTPENDKKYAVNIYKREKKYYPTIDKTNRES